MSDPIAVHSTLTDRYQTTVPETVRRVLRLGKRDKLEYTIRPNGEVVLARAEQPETDDPLLEPFLEFLAQDLAGHPERVSAVGSAWAGRVRELVDGVEVDLDAELPSEMDHSPPDTSADVSGESRPLLQR